MNLTSPSPRPVGGRGCLKSLINWTGCWRCGRRIGMRGSDGGGMVCLLEPLAVKLGAARKGSTV